VALGKVPRGSEALQGAVGPIVVVEILGAGDQGIELGQGAGQVVDRIELLAPSTVDALDPAVELGRLCTARRIAGAAWPGGRPRTWQSTQRRRQPGARSAGRAQSSDIALMSGADLVASGAVALDELKV